MPKESDKATIAEFTGTGLVRVVDDSAGTPLSRNMAVANLADAIAGLSAGDLAALAEAIATNEEVTGRYGRGLLVAGLSAANTGAQNVTALEAAVTAAKAADLGVLLPSGTFDIAGPWTIEAWPGMRIIGHGYEATVLNNTDTSGASAIDVSSNVTIGKDWSIVFEDFRVTGNASSGHGIEVGGGSEILLGPVTFRRVASRDHGGDGFNIGGRLDQVLFDSCIARENDGNGYTTHDDEGLVSEVTLLNCHGNFNTGHGFECGYGPVVNAIGCEFGNNTDVDLSIPSFEQVTLIGCYFESGGDNVHAFIDKPFGSDGPLTMIGCSLNDMSTAGQSAQVTLRSGFATFDGVKFRPKAGGVGVDETHADVQTSYRNCRLVSGNLRRLPDDSVTDQPYTDQTRFGAPSGYYVSSRHAAKTTRAMNVNTCYIAPIEWPGGTADRIGVAVSSEGTAGAVVRLGIYADSNGVPGGLVLDAGTIDSTTTGGKEVTIDEDLPPGRYWVAAAAQTAGCTLRGFTGQLDLPIASSLANAITNNVLVSGYSISSVSGALPASLSSLTALGSTVLVALRVA